MRAALLLAGFRHASIGAAVAALERNQSSNVPFATTRDANR